MIPRPRRGAYRTALIIALGLSVIMLATPVTEGVAKRAPRLPGPTSLATGLLEGAEFTQPNAAARAPWLSRTQALHSSWLRVGAVWLAVVSPNPSRSFRPTDPQDPNYHWDGLDTLLEEATAHGQQVVLTLIDPPSWAISYTSGPAGFNGAPKPSAVGAFARALARRYSGQTPDPAHPGRKLPHISNFQAWNEPNLPALIAPQWTRAGHGRLVAASPTIYRNVLNAIYSGVKAVQPHAYVLAGGLAPYGDSPGLPYNRMQPVTFLANLLCLRPSNLRPVRCRNPAHFDAMDVHPYSLYPTSSAGSPGDVSMANLNRVRRVLTAAQRTRRALPRGFKPIWVTEFGWSSRPPDPQGVPLSTQASYVSRGFFQLWRQGVSHVFWDLLSDYPYKSLTGAGLYYRNGTAKPASVAFRFPFVALRGTHRSVTLWGRAPQRGVVQIEVSRRGAWRNLIRVRTTSGGVFYLRRTIRASVTLRAQSGAYTSLAWTAR